MNAKLTTAIEPPEWPPVARLNPDLVGQAEAEQILLDAFHGRRMAHAWMITGPQGIGKATLAYRFARYALSQGGAGGSPELFGDDLPAALPTRLYVDPETPVFRRVAAGGHGDLLAVERSFNDRGKRRGEIIVDDVREVGGFLSLTASEGGWRVVIVDSADEMNRNAANAVLKVLEEPPDRALLILVSHNPGRLLPTIRSRCRKLSLATLSDQDMVTLVNKYAPELSDQDRTKLIGLSEGSIGRAMGLVAAGGVDLYQECLSLLHSLPQLNIAKLHALADQLAKAGAEDRYATAMTLLRSILAQLLRYMAEGPIDSPSVSDEQALFQRIGPLAGLDRWLEVWEKVCGLLERAGAINLDRKQVVLNVFLEIQGALRKR